MRHLRSFLRLGALAVLCSTAAGCVVVPYGGHRGPHHGAGPRYGGPPVVVIEGDRTPPPRYRR